MTICSDKQPSSAQGSVFFINYGHDSEVILKSVSNFFHHWLNSHACRIRVQFKKKDIVSYQKEIAVLKKLREIGDTKEGFPKLISHKETENSAEFIINVSDSKSLAYTPRFFTWQAQGPNIRKLMQQCPMQKFSTPTSFKIVYKLVSLNSLTVQSLSISFIINSIIIYSEPQF